MTTPTKEQIDAAIMHLEYEINMHEPSRLLGTVLEQQFKTLRFALRAPRLLLDDPCEEIWYAAYYRTDKSKLYINIFKAMRDQLLRKAGSDGKRV